MVCKCGATVKAGFVRDAPDRGRYSESGSAGRFARPRAARRNPPTAASIAQKYSRTRSEGMFLPRKRSVQDCGTIEVRSAAGIIPSGDEDRCSPLRSNSIRRSKAVERIIG